MRQRKSWYRVGAALAASVWLGACENPLERASTEELRASIIDSARRELAEAKGAPEQRALRQTAEPLDLSPERRRELDAMAGASSYEDTVIPQLPDLLGRAGAASPSFRISLEQAVGSAVEHNLALQAARVQPAIAQSNVVAAQAVFDWVFFADFLWQVTDEPSVTVIPGQPAVRNAQDVSYTTGLRKPLTSGGEFSISQGQSYTDDNSPGVNVFPNPANAPFLSLRLDQPLLRGFGSDVALAEIRLAQNFERDAIEALRGQLIDSIVETESAYWRLYEAQRSLQIQRRLLERGIETRDVLESRLGVDARPAEYSDAVARVESRRSNVIRAEDELRRASDNLKRFVNDPELTVGDETLLVAIDAPIEDAVGYSLVDSFATALRKRPEIQRSILSIDDASIRQTVARNARLPRLDLTAEARLLGLDSDLGDAYQQVGDSRFANWLLGLAFEQPIGNRAAEAQYRSSQLQRLLSVVRYRDVVQTVVFDVKNAIRAIDTSYRLIAQSRIAREAAAENLRTLLVLEETIASLNPEFLDLKFRRQDALAVSELEELSSLIIYNVALAELSRATGTAIERNGIRFVVPDADELDAAWASRGASDPGP
jgi:outer membrane protein